MRQITCSSSLRHRRPSTSSLACARYAASPPAPTRCASSASPQSRVNALCERLGVARRHQQRALPVDEQLARGLRVGRDERRAARERLERLVRDHARGLCRRAEHAQRARRSLQLSGQRLVGHPRHVLDIRRPAAEQRAQLAVADHTKAELGHEPCRREHRIQPVQRDQLADEEHCGRVALLLRRREQALLRADEARGDACRPEPRQRREEARIRLRVGHDQVRGAERMPVEPQQCAARRRAGAEAAAVLDERVPQRDQRVEDHRAVPRDAAGDVEVGLPRVPDDDGVRLGGARTEQPGLRREQPSTGTQPRAPLLAAVPHRFVPLLHLHPGLPERGDHLGVARVVALVGAEVEDAQPLAPHQAMPAGQELASST